MKPDPSERNDEADGAHPKEPDTSLKHGIYVVAVLGGCALAVWVLLDFIG